MDPEEFEISESTVDVDRKYSDDIEFLVTQLNQMAHMAGRYDRSVQLRKAFHIKKTLEDMRLIRLNEELVSKIQLGAEAILGAHNKRLEQHPMYPQPTEAELKQQIADLDQQYRIVDDSFTQDHYMKQRNSLQAKLLKMQQRN